MPTSSKPVPSGLRAASIAALRGNLLPGIALWFVGLTVVALYTFVESARPVFNSIIEIKQSYGFLYSGLSTAVFGGLIPFLYLWKTNRVPQGHTLSWLLFFVLFWGIRGVEVDAFYRLQAWMFGDDAEWKTIVTKVLVDQFVYCPLWSAPLTTVCYLWKDVGFSFEKLRQHGNRHLFLFRIPSVLLSVWIVWIPATAIIYSMPLPLQIPLFNLVMCFFVLLVTAMAPGAEDVPPK